MEKSVPFSFVFDYLPAGIITKKMFGMYYIYLGKRIMLILRRRDNEPEWNGIWVATSTVHHPSLKAEVPGLGAFFMNNDERQGNWLVIKETADELEEAGIKVCEMITRGDPRIGKVTEKPPVS